MRLKKIFIPMLALAGIGCAAQAPSSIELARDGQTDYVIVESADATAAEKFAAQELSHYLAKATGAEFKVTTESDGGRPPKAIHVGWTKHASSLLGKERGGLDGEEWILKSVGDNLVLTGGRPRGVLYAVYEFLEKEVGCHWFDETTEVVPKRASLRIRELSERKKPAFYARQIFTDTGDGRETMLLRARNKDTRATLPAELGFGQNTCVHSFFTYSKDFPPEHPEYLAMNISGERPVATNGSGPGQICLTNPGARKLVLEKLKANISKDREAARTAKDGRIPPRVYYLCPNDAPWNCQCPECKTLAEKEQADSGPLVDFVNWMADGIRDEHPNVLVGTFAYANNIRTPKTIRPRDNVLIAVCQLNSEWVADDALDKDEYPDLFRPMTSPINKRACETLTAWSKIAKHMEYWDYWIQYVKDKYPSPYVNIRCLAPDLKLFRDNKIGKYFTEFENPKTNSFHALTCWVGWKLMQNPDQDTKALVRTFMEGYYGPASGKMTEYLEHMEKRIADVPEESGKMSSMAPSQRPYMDLAFQTVSHRLLDEAEAACGTNAGLLLKVRRERIPLDSSLYCMWEQLEKQLKTGQSMPWKQADILKRYRENRLAQVAARNPKGLDKAEEALDRETQNFKGMAANRKDNPPPSVLAKKQPDDKAKGDPSLVEWDKASTFTKWRTPTGAEQPERKIKAAFAHDGKHLYALLEEQGVDTSKLSKAWWAGDGWELFFSTKSRGRPYRQLAVNPEGKHSAFEYEKEQKAWNSGVIIKTDSSESCWRTLVAIPLSSLMTEEDIDARRPLFFNVFRVTPSPGLTMCASPIYESNFHDMSQLAELRLEADWPEAKENLALGKSCSFNKAPNYSHCKNPDKDAAKLTDGEFVQKGTPIWFDKKNTVGITGDNVEVTINLGKAATIRKVLFSSAAGISDVTPPKSIKVYVSKDGKEYSLAGEEKPEAQQQSGYKTFTITAPLKEASGQYVKVRFDGAYYFFCDELAVVGDK